MTDHRMYDELATEEVVDSNQIRLEEPVPSDHFPRVWRTVDGDGEWLEAEFEGDDRRHIRVEGELDGAEFIKTVAVPNE